MKSQTIGIWPLVILILLLNITAQMIHEMGHWAIYQAYGRGPVWGFIGVVQLWGTTPLHPAEWVSTVASDGTPGWLRLGSPTNSPLEKFLVSAGGPVASLLTTIWGLVLTRRSRDAATQHLGLGLALVTSLTMTLYYLRSPWRTGGDEYDMAVQLSLTKAAIEIPFALAFAFCFAWGLRAIGTWKARLIGLAVILLGGVSTGIALNYADTIVRSQVNAEHPWFIPIAGFSLPVVVVIILAILGLWRWQHMMKASRTAPNTAGAGG